MRKTKLISRQPSTSRKKHRPLLIRLNGRGYDYLNFYIIMYRLKDVEYILLDAPVKGFGILFYLRRSSLELPTSLPARIISPVAAAKLNIKPGRRSNCTEALWHTVCCCHFCELAAGCRRNRHAGENRDTNKARWKYGCVPCLNCLKSCQENIVLSTLTGYFKNKIGDI